MILVGGGCDYRGSNSLIYPTTPLYIPFLSSPNDDSVELLYCWAVLVEGRLIKADINGLLK